MQTTHAPRPWLEAVPRGRQVVRPGPGTPCLMPESEAAPTACSACRCSRVEAGMDPRLWALTTEPRGVYGVPLGRESPA